MDRGTFAFRRPRFGDLEPAFALQPVLDLLEPPFTGPKRRGARMHRVILWSVASLFLTSSVRPARAP